MDLGYRVFNSIIRYISDSYTIFLLCYASLTYLVIYKVLINYSINPLMSLCIYYCSYIGLMGCNRQLLAMFFCLISLKFIIDRKFIYYILCLGVATLIHKTAIIFFPAYFIARFQFSKSIVIIIVISSFIVGVSRLINHLPFVEYLALIDKVDSSSSDFSVYLGQEISGVSIVGSFKRLLFVSFALYSRDKINSKYYDMFLLFYIVGVCIYLMFNGSVLQLMAGRGAIYYNFFECLVIPVAIYNCKFFVNRKVIWFVFFLFYMYIMWRDMNSYLLLDGKDIFNPYKSVLF